MTATPSMETSLLVPPDRLRDGRAAPLRPYIELWRDSVLRFGERVAVSDATGALSYLQLDGLARRVAESMRAHGVRRGDVVGILRERDALTLVATLAVFELGAAYLPLDPTVPVARLRTMVERCGCRLILGASCALSGSASLSRELNVAVEDLDAWAALGPQFDAPPSCERSLDDVAYVIFTSGSTGTPKGVAMTQRGMVNHLWAKIEELEVGPEDTIGQTTPHGFDPSVWQYLAGGLVGARAEVVPHSVASDPGALLDRVQTAGISVLTLVPSYLGLLLQILSLFGEGDRPTPRLRRMVMVGEALPVNWARQWFDYCQVPLVNAYGPTECGADVTHHVMHEAPAGLTVPLGRAIRGARLLVVDERLQPVPAGVHGELLIGGAPVGAGYVGEPQLTATAFVSLPDLPGRWYRTGDCVHESEGVYWFHGRFDHQLKLRGHRIEPGEIEAQLCADMAVHAAVVLQYSEGDRTEIVSVVQPAGTPDPDLGRRLKVALGQKLPEYMVPHSIHFVRELPLTSNGKVDRDRVAAILRALEPFAAPR